jgi:hypothetical protein
LNHRSDANRKRLSARDKSKLNANERGRSEKELARERSKREKQQQQRRPQSGRSAKRSAVGKKRRRSGSGRRLRKLANSSDSKSNVRAKLSWLHKKRHFVRRPPESRSSVSANARPKRCVVLLISVE